MSKIVAISTNVPNYKHNQANLCKYANSVFSKTDEDVRKLNFLYNRSGIENRYSILPDFSLPEGERKFFITKNNQHSVPDIESRMALYDKEATAISVKTIEDCIANIIKPAEITHLITVSCTGMSAPGLDLQIMEQMNLPETIVRTSINFMGCYAAVHGLKLADAFCNGNSKANVIVVCTEFCTLHFQTATTVDSLTSSLLFADGCAAVLVQPSNTNKGLELQNFYSYVAFKGKDAMSWSLASTGFLMTLSGYVPELLKADFDSLVSKALQQTNHTKKDITHWCIHPGGKKILENIATSLELEKENFDYSYQVLNDYGNMSSPTILFVLQKILADLVIVDNKNATIFGAAFGPGLTMETFTATYG